MYSKQKRSLYFWFTGGLLEVDGVKIVENEYLDYKNPDNCPILLSKKGTATIPSHMTWGEVDDHIYHAY